MNPLTELTWEQGCILESEGGNWLLRTFHLICGTPIWLTGGYFLLIFLVAYVLYRWKKNIIYSLVVFFIGLLVIYAIKWEILNFMVKDGLLTTSEGKSSMMKIIYTPFSLYYY